jgi:hypothetical protein
MDILYWQSVLLGTSHYEILVPRIRLETVVDRIATGNIGLNLNLLSIRRLHPQTLVMVTGSEALRAIQGRLFGGRNFIDYAKD